MRWQVAAEGIVCLQEVSTKWAGQLHVYFAEKGSRPPPEGWTVWENPPEEWTVCGQEGGGTVYARGGYRGTSLIRNSPLR